MKVSEVLKRAGLSSTLRGVVALLLALTWSYSTRIEPANAQSILQKGVASWYGDSFHGRKTASGERYNMNELTAAHRSLPFGALVTVKSLTTQRTVTVRINDRGPFSGNRIIDLSYEAARQLGIVNKGKDRVVIVAQEEKDS